MYNPVGRTSTMMSTEIAAVKTHRASCVVLAVYVLLTAIADSRVYCTLRLQRLAADDCMALIFRIGASSTGRSVGLVCIRHGHRLFRNDVNVCN